MQAGAEVTRAYRAVVDWALYTEGSTRTAGLIRIGLALNLWTLWGEQLVLWRVDNYGFDRILLTPAFFLSSTAMLIGLWARKSTLAAGVVAFIMYGYFGIIGGEDAWTHHHTYLLVIATLLCALTPCDKSYSVDRWLAVRRAEKQGAPAPAERANLWGVRLLALQMSAVYLYAAWNKSHMLWLSGVRLDEIAMKQYFGSAYPQFLHVFTVPMAWVTLALEYGLGIGLLFAATRKWLVLPGLLLHAGFYVLLPVPVFTTTVFVLYLAYFNADKVHEVIDRLQGYAPPPAVPKIAEAVPPSSDKSDKTELQPAGT